MNEKTKAYFVVYLLFLMLLIVMYFAGKYAFLVFNDLTTYYKSSELDSDIELRYQKELDENIKLRKTLSQLKPMRFSNNVLHTLLKKYKIKILESNKEYIDKGERISLLLYGKYKNIIFFLFSLETNFGVNWEYILMRKQRDFIEVRSIFFLKTKESTENED